MEAFRWPVRCFRLFDEETDLSIEDLAFVFMSPNDLIEDQDMTVLNFLPRN